MSASGQTPLLFQPRPKLIYFARRNPALDPAAFVARWQQHGRLGMSLPRWRNIWRYEQCDRMPGTSNDADDCDGVALVWYRDHASRLAHGADEAGRAIMRTDESKTFAEPVAQVSLLTDESIVVSGTGDLRMYIQVWRSPEVEREAFMGLWASEVGARLSPIATARGGGHRQNFPSGAVLSALDCDCVDEIASDEDERLAEEIAATLLGTPGVRRLIRGFRIHRTRSRLMYQRTYENDAIRHSASDRS